MFLKDVPCIHQDSAATCWYAAVLMLAAYKKQTIFAQAAVPLAKQVLTADLLMELAHAAGLNYVPGREKTFSWRFIDNTLKTHGPIWAAGNWNGSDHVIVVTGVDESGRMTINDPAFGAPQTREMGWFNAHINTDYQSALMYLPDRAIPVKPGPSDSSQPQQTHHEMNHQHTRPSNG
jgi:ABC-type bacteriocin/lantibiotic exporter with double-glycine peptidase domain